MENLRKYGNPPYTVAVIHGGPGAPGYMAPIARKLSGIWGVIEPLQTEASLNGQVNELYTVLKDNGNLPINLIGSSWGAMLGFILTALYPEMIKKLILVGSAIFEAKYALKITETRLKRLSSDNRSKALILMETMENPSVKDKNKLLMELSNLFNKSDFYDPFTLDTEVIESQFDINLSVWKDAEELRNSGKLLELGKKIQCPVVAIHGDYDPHPQEGIQEPLSRVLKNFKFILLEKCGHFPWIEKYASDNFYEILQKELE